MANKEIRRTSRLLLMDQVGRLLLGQRDFLSKQRPGQLDVIGGSVDPGEPAAHTAVREPYEELGLDISPYRVAHVLRWRDRDGRYVFNRDYYYTQINGSFDDYQLKLSENLGAAALFLDEAASALRYPPHVAAVQRLMQVLPGPVLVA